MMPFGTTILDRRDRGEEKFLTSPPTSAKTGRPRRRHRDAVQGCR